MNRNEDRNTLKTEDEDRIIPLTEEELEKVNGGDGDLVITGKFICPFCKKQHSLDFTFAGMTNLNMQFAVLGATMCSGSEILWVTEYSRTPGVHVYIGQLYNSKAGRSEQFEITDMDAHIV